MKLDELRNRHRKNHVEKSVEKELKENSTPPALIRQAAPFLPPEKYMSLPRLTELNSMSLPLKDHVTYVGQALLGTAIQDYGWPRETRIVDSEARGPNEIHYYLDPEERPNYITIMGSDGRIGPRSSIRGPFVVKFDQYSQELACNMEQFEFTVELKTGL